MDSIWKEYAGDFNSMTDDEIELEVNQAQALIDENQSWVDAVSSWKRAGRPRGDDK